MILLTLMPISCAAPLSSDTASMARPVLVFFTNSVSAAIRIAPTMRVMSVETLILTLPKESVPKLPMLTGCALAPKTSCATLCSR